MLNLTPTSTVKDIEELWYSITNKPIKYYYHQYILSFKYTIYTLIDIINKSIKTNKLYSLIDSQHQIYIYKNEMYYDNLYFEFEFAKSIQEESNKKRFNYLRKNTEEKIPSSEVIKLICLSNLYFYKTNKFSIPDSLVSEYVYIYNNINNLILRGE